MGLRDTQDFRILKEVFASGYLSRKMAVAALRYYVRQNLYRYGTSLSPVELVELRAAIEKGHRERNEHSRTERSCLNRIKRIAIRLNPFMGSSAVEVEFRNTED